MTEPIGRLVGYPLALAAAALVSLGCTLILARRRGLPLGYTTLLHLLVMTAALLGAKTYAGLEGATSSGRAPLDAMGMRYPGLVVGVLAFAPIAHAILRPPFPLTAYADVGSAGLAAAMAVVRVGCLSAGCCHGAPSSGPWSVTFAKGTVAWRDHLERGWIDAGAAASLPVFPLQLALGAWSLLVAVALIALLRVERLEGRLCWIYLAFHDGGKALLETLRDPPAGHLQAASLALAALGILGLGLTTFTGHRRNR